MIANITTALPPDGDAGILSQDLDAYYGYSGFHATSPFRGGTTAKEAISRFPPGKHVSNALSLYWAARSIKTSAVRRKHPELTDTELHDRVRDHFIGIEVQFREYDYQVIVTSKEYVTGKKELPYDAD